jgi:hypothetical protein
MTTALHVNVLTFCADILSPLSGALDNLEGDADPRLAPWAKLFRAYRHSESNQTSNIKYQTWTTNNSNYEQLGDQ